MQKKIGGLFGELIKETSPEGIQLVEKNCLIGIGFSAIGVPIDVVGLFLAGIDAKKYSILLVDEFQRFNQFSEREILTGLEKTKKSIRILSKLYCYQPEVIVSSEFMRSQQYKQVVENIEERIKEIGLEKDLLETVPPKYRVFENPVVYPLNELACVEFLRKNNGIEVKIGPSKEHEYDRIMRKLGFGVDFAYLIDSYAVGTENGALESVIHYIPESRGTGQRIFLEEIPYKKEEEKIMMGPEEAARYFLMVASASGHRLNKSYLSNEEINNLSGKKLKKTAKRLILENILNPYQEVAENEP